MFRIDHSCDTALFLSLGDSVDREGSLTAGLRTVDFDDTAAGITAYTQGMVQGDTSRRNNLNISLWLVAELHNRPFSIIFLDLVESCL